MERVIRCSSCNELIGVTTDKGVVIGNVILIDFYGFCSCGEEIIYNLDSERYEIISNE